MGANYCLLAGWLAAAADADLDDLTVSQLSLTELGRRRYALPGARDPVSVILTSFYR